MNAPLAHPPRTLLLRLLSRRLAVAALSAVWAAITLAASTAAEPVPLSEFKWIYRFDNDPPPANVTHIYPYSPPIARTDDAGNTVLIIPLGEGGHPFENMTATRIVWINFKGKIRHFEDYGADVEISLLSLTPNKVILKLATASEIMLRTLKLHPSSGRATASDTLLPDGFRMLQGEVPAGKGLVLWNGPYVSTAHVEFRYYP